MSAPTLPLKGIRIADFTIHAAGPFGTHVLSQLGAECIKIESRTRPDAFRKPHAVYGRMTAATFDQVASNKLSVRLNLKKPEAVEIARRIVAVSDIAAESFRPGVLKRLGLGFDELVKVRPDLLMLSLSSSGQSGPDSHFAGYAPLFGAWGGLGWMTGYPDGPPVEIRHVMDHTSGYHAAVAILAGLHQRRRTGKPQYIDLAAREVSSAMVGDALVMASMGLKAERPGNGDPGMAPHGVYETAKPDRWLSIAVRNDAEWHKLLEVLDVAVETVRPEFSSAHGRRENRESLDRQMSQWLSHFDADNLAGKLQAVGVCAQVSLNMQDIADDEHLHQRGTLVSVDDPSVDRRFAVGFPARFSKTGAVGIHRGTPELGQDEDYVFGELLGMNRDARADLEAREVIF
ncbi:CaiB/BaiF CoA transferase family protein [Haliea sp. E17]|uniref:CaiB/BaiF CoA transferase family protein n=1 Tax=Haliea sp. E17 TaxID=3401576 RepID=UPI003AAC20FC